MIVSFDVTEPVPEIDAGWAAEQVGVSDAPDGPAEIAHVSATLPVNPPLGAIVMVELVEPPARLARAKSRSKRSSAWAPAL